MVRDRRRWTVAVAGGKEEPADAEGFMREVLLFAERIPGLTLRVADLRSFEDEALPETLSRA
jgi:hypothetical protein